MAVLEVLTTLVILAMRVRVYAATTSARLRRQPGIDPADPELRETSRYAFGAAGFRSDGSGLYVGGPWIAMHDFDETTDDMYPMLGPRIGFIIPKRDLAPATVLAVRDLRRRARIGATRTVTIDTGSMRRRVATEA